MYFHNDNFANIIQRVLSVWSIEFNIFYFIKYKNDKIKSSA